MSIALSAQSEPAPVAYFSSEEPVKRSSRWLFRILATFLILSFSLAHISYLTSSKAFELAPDEAHYWDWSRHLDWSYYSKGPLVAYLIRAGCELAGSWSEHAIGNQMLAVRLPAVLCGALLLVSLYVLTVQVFRREGLALAVVAMALTLPIVSAGALLMTIDAPYTCCWGWALVLGLHAVRRRASWAWLATGLIVGLGILAKYTMVLWIPSLFLFLLATPSVRGKLLRPGPWLMAAVAACCCLPILIWNVQHDWVTLKHVGGQAGLQNARGILWHGPLVYVGMQAALLLGFWFVVWVAAMWTHRPRQEDRQEILYLWWMSAPMFGVFLVFSLKTPEEPNWPVTAYISGLVLAAGWLSERHRRRFLAVGTAGACALGLMLTVLAHRTDWIQPFLLQIVGEPTAERPLPLRRIDPTCRLRGWRTLAAEVDRMRAGLRSEGIEPLLAASAWNLPGELGFYCQGHPIVYSFGLALGDRHSQYDLWRPNPIWDGKQFEGATFVFVGDLHASVREAFAETDAPSHVVHYENGHPIASWTVTVCRGFKGLPQLMPGTGQPRF